MRRIVGITGTPGTGKKTVAPLVATLVGLPSLSLSSLTPIGEPLVDTEKLRKALMRSAAPCGVVFGHLLPHVLTRREVELVAVLRCEPLVLRRRLAERGYEHEKVAENVEAELIGVVLDECVRKFGGDAVKEYDTTSASPREVALAISKDVEAPLTREKKGPGVWIDWTLDYDSPTKLRSLLG